MRVLSSVGRRVWSTVRRNAVVDGFHCQREGGRARLKASARVAAAFFKAGKLPALCEMSTLVGQTHGHEGIEIREKKGGEAVTRGHHLTPGRRLPAKAADLKGGGPRRLKSALNEWRSERSEESQHSFPKKCRDASLGSA